MPVSLHLYGPLEDGSTIAYKFKKGKRGAYDLHLEDGTYIGSIFKYINGWSDSFRLIGTWGTRRETAEAMLDAWRRRRKDGADV